LGILALEDDLFVATWTLSRGLACLREEDLAEIVKTGEVGYCHEQDYIRFICELEFFYKFHESEAHAQVNEEVEHNSRVGCSDGLAEEDLIRLIHHIEAEHPRVREEAYDLENVSYYDSQVDPGHVILFVQG